MSDLALRFQQLVMPYTGHPEIGYEMWIDIEKAHQEKKRYYHNLTHLENLFTELSLVQDQINDWETVSFAVFYHDVVYKVQRKDNEERSADWAVKDLDALSYPSAKVKRCKSHIIATKSHEVTEDNDANLFTDADLSILGKEWEVYKQYFENIRKEYRIYPNPLYKPARKKALQHFLEMKHIYKTDVFRQLYETSARRNMARELKEM